VEAPIASRVARLRKWTATERHQEQHRCGAQCWQSAALWDKLLAGVASLTSTELAVTWATQALPAKNSLIAADAKLLKEAFEQKLSRLSSGVVEETSAPPWHRG
jgi:hypothetical protein